MVCPVLQGKFGQARVVIGSRAKVRPQKFSLFAPDGHVIDAGLSPVHQGRRGMRPRRPPGSGSTSKPDMPAQTPSRLPVQEYVRPYSLFSALLRRAHCQWEPTVG